MYKKKVSPVHHRYAPYIASLSTLLIILLVEYIFAVPSTWLQKIPQVSPFSENIQNEESCTEEYAPVCGKDGRTYTNSCIIRSAGVAVAKVGSCASLPQSESQTSSEDSLDSESTEVSVIDQDVNPPESDDTRRLIDLSNGQIYTSNVYKYSVTLPKYAYYQGSNAPNKAGHRLAIDLSSSGSSNFDIAMIRTLYSPSGSDTLPDAKKTITLGEGILSISYEEPLSMRAMDIIRALEQSAKSLSASGAQ